MYLKHTVAVTLVIPRTFSFFLAKRIINIVTDNRKLRSRYTKNLSPSDSLQCFTLCNKEFIVTFTDITMLYIVTNRSSYNMLIFLMILRFFLCIISSTSYSFTLALSTILLQHQSRNFIYSSFDATFILNNPDFTQFNCIVA